MSGPASPARACGDGTAVAGAERLAVTVVVCAYTMDRWTMTRTALISALSQQPPPAEVILVADHNSDLAATARREVPEVTVLDSDGAPGLSGARNTGLRAASQPVTVFLDDDAEARPGWLAALTGPYQLADVIGTGGHIEPRWHASRPSWLPPAYDWVVGCSYVGLPESEDVIRNPIGANMSMRTQHALDAGGFDELIGRVAGRPRGCEETALAIRMTQARPGAKIVYVPAAVVDHQVGPDRTRLGYFLRRCWHEGQSKAAVVRLVGAAPALARERRQVTVVIPAALLSDLRALLAGRLSGAGRMGASVSGLAASALGYLAARALFAATTLAGRSAAR